MVDERWHCSHSRKHRLQLHANRGGCGGGLTGPLVSYGLAVRVREGDRALLPGAFCFPWSRISYKVQGSWLINDAYGETKTENIVYSSVSKTSPIEGYRGRVALVGSLSSGSCSLEIRDARKGDSRTFFFHANSDGTKFSGDAGITITAIPTRVALTPAPLELRATEPATLDCSVDAVFPMDSVTVRWILVDAVKWTNSTSQSRSPDGTFTVTSRLSFTPSAEDDGKKCRCEASGGDLVSTMVQEFILVVKYAPVVVNLSQDEKCGGGGNLCIFCEVEANPRANITWRTMESDASELIQTQDGNGTVTLSSLVMKRSQEQNVTCVAANEPQGAAASPPHSLSALCLECSRVAFHVGPSCGHEWHHGNEEGSLSAGGAGSGCWCVLSLLAPVVAWTAVGLCLLLLWREAGEGGAGAHDKARPVHGTDTEGIRMEVATPATDLRSSPD
ncbi:unnamed protein product [Lampetra fluviatilis]